MAGRFVVHRRFNLTAPPAEEFDIIDISDAYITHSCSNYVDDGTTVFSRDGSLVLKVASHCKDGGCMNSGRVMSRSSFKYGLFEFTARVPKCNYVWPALWLLPENTHGEGSYGRWPCSGEIDLLETVHNHTFGTFNLIAGYGSSGGCEASAETTCNGCVPGYCVSTTYNESEEATADRYFVEDVDCSAEPPHMWKEHTFVMSWQPDEVAMWVDPTFERDGRGRVRGIAPKKSDNSEGYSTWKVYRRESTPQWQAVEGFMDQCFPEANNDAPFDDRFKLVLNIAVGGYGGSACQWGSHTCQTECGGAIGSELIVSDITVWELAQ